jgi:hypothetical protein
VTLPRDRIVIYLHLIVCNFLGWSTKQVVDGADEEVAAVLELSMQVCYSVVVRIRNCLKILVVKEHLFLCFDRSLKQKYLLLAFLERPFC